MFRAPARRTVKTAAPKSFAAPTAGWISNRNLANPKGPQGAEVLENIFPMATTALIRRGSVIYATLGMGDLPVTSMFTYNYGNDKRLFSATENTVYDITTVVTPINYQLSTDEDELVDDLGNVLGDLSTVGLEVITAATSGEWIDEQFTTDGGKFLVIVNGADDMQVFDGLEWTPIADQNITKIVFSAKTVAFTVGEVITGATSTATASIIKIVDNGATGYLLVGTVTGTFVDGEVITGATAGHATIADAPAELYIGITGVDTSQFSYVWAYSDRLFFIERDSLNVWYLPIAQLGGAATLLPLGSQFSLGGSLVIGATWSAATGTGLQEFCVFISDEGEAVAYNGNDPSVSTSWVKVGRYQTGKPRGPKAFIHAGGDLVLATDIGFVALSQSLQTDYSVLSPKAVSYPIETAWNNAVTLRQGGNWDCIIWPERQMVVVAPPTINEQPPEMYVSNARTGAWGKFTNWNGTCLEIHEGRLFFGTPDGKIVEAYVAGTDQGQPFTAAYVPLFTDLGYPAAAKIPLMVRPVVRGTRDVDIQVSVQESFVINLPSVPAATPVPAGSQWDVGVWSVSQWGSASPVKTQSDWQSVGGFSDAISPAMQITSGSIIPLDTEIVRLDMTFSLADLVT